MNRTWLPVLAASALVVVVLLRGWWTPVRAIRPEPVPVAQAEVWMVDALPDVGPQRREGAVRSVREGRFDELPRRARVLVPEVFQCASAP